ncbi:DUF202 domain-containing protein [Pseudonocardia asaccharolytica]|uniref:DUF202 domain-containing protein n=1 Tax=Pseudonocardia asaccharolytica TaxID=54010 RepID=UPI00137787E3|nr:DUF202 domain-containing protein [Pseudonocardia asaccharolytica]
MNDQVWDAGLQPERTALAWQRTALASIVTALGTIRLALHHSSIAAVVIASLALALGAATIIGLRVRYRRSIRRLASGRPIGLLGPALLTSASIAALGCAAIVLLLR